MNYEKIYHLLIEKADNRCILPGIYKEKHHIIPKCIGGLDKDPNNIIELFPEEHFVAHQLLYKIYNEPKLLYALSCMKRKNNNQIRNNKLYSWIKENFSKNHSTYMSEYWKSHPNPMLGKNHSEETIQKMRNDPSRKNSGERNGMFGKNHSEETIQKMKDERTGEKNSMFGKNHSEKTKRKMSELALGRPSAFLGKNHSEKTKIKMSEKAKNRAKKYSFIIEGISFEGTLKEAYINFNIPRSTFERKIKDVKYANFCMMKN